MYNPANLRNANIAPSIINIKNISHCAVIPEPIIAKGKIAIPTINKPIKSQNNPSVLKVSKNDKSHKLRPNKYEK
jgi:hypothetical protein